MHMFCITVRNGIWYFVIFFVASGLFTFVSLKKYLVFIFISCETLMFLRQVTMKFQVLAVMITKVSVLLDLTPCRLVELYRNFRGNHCLLS
jgi:hypothetical protein